MKRGIVTLRGEVDRRSEKEILAALAWRIDGVVGVKDELSYRTDDRELRPETPRSDRLGRELAPAPLVSEGIDDGDLGR